MNQAVQRGVLFEICYSLAIKGVCVCVFVCKNLIVKILFIRKFCGMLFRTILSCFYQELIEPAKRAKEHVTS